MRLFQTVVGLRCYLNRYRSDQPLLDRSERDVSVERVAEIGLVPTMGALHAGHLSLIQRARRENKLVVVSIFVNPLQFAPTEDFQHYPRTLERDRALCEQAGVDVIFAPGAAEMGVGNRESGVRSQESGAKVNGSTGEAGVNDFRGSQESGEQGDTNTQWIQTSSPSSLIPPQSGSKLHPSSHRKAEAGYIPHPSSFISHPSSLIPPQSGSKLHPSSLSPTQVMPPEAMTSVLCGRSRVGHFQGVATIVTKLLNIVQPQRAYFGQKDAQQLAIIQRLVADLNLPVTIVGCPTVREASGLAFSSRNQYLTVEQKEQAAALYRGLRAAEQAFRSGDRVSERLIKAVKTELEHVPAIAPEYIELVHPSTLEPLHMVQETGLLAIAARLGSTRLIDNLVLSARKPIVAIDGPAGAGKSTVARQVAQQLDLLYLDTGAMYRALTWLVLQSGIAVDDEPSIAELVSQCDIAVSGQPSAVSVSINGQDVTQDIRSLEVTANVSAISAQPAVRHELVRQQRRYGKHGGIVIDGRDIGTYVFPDAELKLFLTASVQERARRRQQDLKNQGATVTSLDVLEQAIYDRDRKDSTRTLAPLRQAEDAIEIQTDDLSITQVVDRIVQLYLERAEK